MTTLSWWSLRGAERERAKLADERIRKLRNGRYACRDQHWQDEHTRYFIGADGRYEFPAGDSEKKHAAREAARQSYDKLLETI